MPKKPVISHWNSRASTVKLRTGKHSLDPKIMNVVVHCQAKYKLSENDTIGFWVYFANMTLDQTWYKAKEGKWKQDQKIKTKIGTKEKKNT